MCNSLIMSPFPSSDRCSSRTLPTLKSQCVKCFHDIMHNVQRTESSKDICAGYSLGISGGPLWIFSTSLAFRDFIYCLYNTEYAACTCTCIYMYTYMHIEHTVTLNLHVSCVYMNIHVQCTMYTPYIHSCMIGSLLVHVHVHVYTSLLHTLVLRLFPPLKT